MRNDARPIGENSPASPVGGHESPTGSERSDSRDSMRHQHGSRVIDHEPEEDEDRPPTMDDSDAPSSDSTGK
jgi:hypothetical protein